MADKLYLKSQYDANTSPLTEYILETSLREPQFLQKLREETGKLGRLAVMLVDPIESQFLRLLVGVSGAKRCLEIGTFTGYNACSLALALPDDGEIIACDISDKFINIGRPLWPAECAKKIKVKLAPALDTLDQLIAEGQTETFDFAFVDADKANYDNYYERALLLLRKGGLIVIDNALWYGRVAQNEAEFDDETKVIHQLNCKMKSDERIDVSFLEVGDGTYIGRKK